MVGLFSHGNFLFAAVILKFLINNYNKTRNCFLANKPAGKCQKPRVVHQKSTDFWVCSEIASIYYKLLRFLTCQEPTILEHDQKYIIFLTFEHGLNVVRTYEIKLSMVRTQFEPMKRTKWSWIWFERSSNLLDEVDCAYDYAYETNLNMTSALAINYCYQNLISKVLDFAVQ